MTLIKIGKHTHRIDNKKDVVCLSKDARLHIGVDIISKLNAKSYVQVYVDDEQKLICIEFKDKDPNDRSLYSVTKGTNEYYLRISKALGFYGLICPGFKTDLKYYIEDGKLFVNLDHKNLYNIKTRKAK